MSAFLVHKAHVAAIVRWYVHSGGRQYESDCGLEDWPLVKANMLYAQNVRSVNERYPESVPEEPGVFTFSDIEGAPALSPIACIKAVHSLAYQSCETEDWERTAAKRLLDSIESHAITKVPGYDDAEWVIEPAGVRS